jgi:DNA polymerase I-like protein with 3'-5' exonuclease and polymerase domains
MKKHGRFLITVHDEINISVPKEYADEEMEILKKAMNSVPLDVPLLSDGKVGPNWGNMKKFVDKE